MKNFIERLFTFSTSDPEDTRKRRILGILLAGTAGVALLGMLSFIYFAATVDPAEFYLLLWGSALTFILVIIVYAVNYFGSGRAAAVLFLIFLYVIFLFSDTPDQIVGGRTLFAFTIPIFMASILLTPASSFIFAGISGAVVLYLAVSLEITPNIPGVFGFFLIAFVSWLSARSLEQALSELRSINLNLDRVVAERTEALAESLAREKIEAGRNQAILNSIADGVIVFDKRWNATMANPAIKSMLDIPLQLIINKNFRELVEHPRLAPNSRALLGSMIEHGTQPIGFRVEWGDKTLSVSAAQIYDQRREDTGTVIVFRDFTREAEVERLKSTFVGIVSHELRTPLNAILGYAEMFKEAVYGPVNEKQVNMADRIMKNTQRLLALINDLLDQAQIEAGKLTISNQTIRPAELLETMHSLMDKPAADKNLKLTSEIEDDFPERLVGDPARLQQILVNLVGNSVKFTHRGFVHVKLLRQDERWGIEVTDSGQGIPEFEIPHIFETFRQVDGAATREHGGFGLGLSIVKQLVGLMNGEISVTSQLGEGSVFLIRFPLLAPKEYPTAWRSS
ncbi:MAG: Sensor histidine kinase RcsC [Anaerolineales bacterium]|nr:PAS domain-containing protein [Anaerolineae bacterium]MBL8106376.1 PAS domain-containing protein [Anaerolineales bacterium]MBV6402762.1 Sensor histidine kinase RcsC [Anaerolineales bacterium]MCC7189888.1 PAS domain-containing protein [Anaerolineales bacterium]